MVRPSIVCQQFNGVRHRSPLAASWPDTASQRCGCRKHRSPLTARGRDHPLLGYKTGTITGARTVCTGTKRASGSGHNANPRTPVLTSMHRPANYACLRRPTKGNALCTELQARGPRRMFCHHRFFLPSREPAVTNASAPWKCGDYAVPACWARVRCWSSMMN